MTFMRRIVLAGVASATLVAPALAQTLVIQPEQQTVIREYVVRQNPQPIEVIPDYDFAVGTTVPDVVELRPVEVPELTDRYEYVVTNSGQTVLVEPGTRRVVQIVD